MSSADYTPIKVEDQVGKPLSPYAATKAMDEMYAAVFALTYGLPAVGLRYFNVFAPRQDPNGPYAAVIPLWVQSLIKQTPIFINGDGETGRDFCYVANAVQANLLAATASAEAANQVWVNRRTRGIRGKKRQSEVLKMPRQIKNTFFATDSFSACSAYSAVHLQFLDFKFQINYFSPLHKIDINKSTRIFTFR